MPITKTLHPFTDQEIDNAPDSQGVYALYEGKEATYYGSSDVSIRDRLRAHKSGNEGRCTQGAAEFNSEYAADPLAREKELLEDHKRVFGKLPKCNALIP